MLSKHLNKLVRPEGIEPSFLDPESSALSVELRALTYLSVLQTVSYYAKAS